MHVVTVVGARPNFMKAAPVHRAFVAFGHRHEIVHTGQHYDSTMSQVFFDQLGMPRPAIYLGVGSGSHAQQTAAVISGLEPVLTDGRPDLLLVVGDVNSTLGAALVAAKLRVPVGHVEAGLRSRDWSMPEEVNRAVTDVLSDLLLTPSPDADQNLLAEGRHAERIVRVGNVMIDTLLHHLEAAQKTDPWPAWGRGRPERYGVLTLHRPANVDDPKVLRRLMEVVCELSQEVPVVFPAHPRTRARLEALAFQPPQGLLLADPLGYLTFLGLVAASTLVLTDSGGLQEECTALGIPCLTLRENTERPITVEQGTNQLVGADPDRIRMAYSHILNGGGKSGGVPELWDGHTGPRIVTACETFLNSDHLAWPR